MKREEIAALLIEIIQDILPDEDCSDIDPDIKLREQLGLDSMDFLDIIMELRKTYGVEITEDNYKELTTVNSCVNFLEPILKDKDR